MSQDLTSLISLCFTKVGLTWHLNDWRGLNTRLSKVDPVIHVGTMKSLQCRKEITAPSIDKLYALPSKDALQARMTTYWDFASEK